MNRYILTVPSADNNGKGIPRVHEYVRNVLVEEFGGCGVSRSQGYFAGETHIYGETTAVYTVDSRPGDRTLFGESALAEMRELAAYVKREAAQEAVYLAYWPITVECE